MEVLPPRRVVVAKNENITVWYANPKSAIVDENGKIGVECPHCGEEAFVLDIERSDESEVEMFIEDQIGKLCTK